ncbi:hyaluronidase-3 [Trichomycterus rosablanca]|uniref:hyaluronidase-3 n=1 Tax=Trichomycterus rosablanca TaxID=2290929 RepID=UPI002F35B180
MFWWPFTPLIPLLTFTVLHCCPALGSVIKKQAFSVVWNMPTSKCQRLYGVSLPLSQHGIIHNVKQRFLGENISLFYERRLGLYPYIGPDGLRVNGGLPQLGDLDAHLAVMDGQIHALMRKHFSGLAVLDWEKWQPLWVRNYGDRKTYGFLSRLLVRQRHPEMSEKEVTKLAMAEFEQAAKAYMVESLRLGVKNRPRGLWGFYGFPGCYNYHGSRKLGYTGQCKPRTKAMNDRLAFLWQQSTALYPSVYVPQALAGHPNTRLMVRYRVLEAMRVATQHARGCSKIPVLPYARVAFIRTLHFLNQTDLENTLGEIAALGAAGVVLWGDLGFAKSKHQCVLLRDYISSVLGVYVDALHQKVTRCSKSMCSGHGRCTRRDPHSSHMIPLLEHGSEPDHGLMSNFTCMCYEAWSGKRCEKNNMAKKRSQC